MTGSRKCSKSAVGAARAAVAERRPVTLGLFAILLIGIPVLESAEPVAGLIWVGAILLFVPRVHALLAPQSGQVSLPGRYSSVLAAVAWGLSLRALHGGDAVAFEPIPEDDPAVLAAVLEERGVLLWEEMGISEAEFRDILRGVEP